MTDGRSDVRRRGAALCLAAVLALLALPQGGCSQNTCDQAAQHEIDCKVASNTTSSSTGEAVLGSDCSGVTECDSACIAKASCAELQNYSDQRQSKALRDCLELCTTAAAQAAN